MDQDPRTRREPSESSITPFRFTLKVLAKWAEGSLTADGWIQEKPCRVTIDTGASVTVARPDIVEGLPIRELSRPYVLLTASGGTIPVVKKARLELTLGWRTLRRWVFVADITNDFILGLDILRAYDSSVDVGLRVLRLGRDVVPVREAPTASVLKRTGPTVSRRNGRPVCWQCGRTGHVWKGCPRRSAKEVVDERDWSRDCAVGGIGEARRQMAE
jgi:predicted aspartyl protease